MSQGKSLRAEASQGRARNNMETSMAGVES